MEEQGQAGMDHLERSSLNGFVARSFDRAAHRRHDPNWMVEKLSDPGARFIAVWQGMNLFSQGAIPAPIFLSSKDLAECPLSAEAFVFLGESEETAYFGVSLPSDEDSPLLAALNTYGQFLDLRKLGPLLRRREAHLLAYARAMTYWHQRHRFCGDCGSRTVVTFGGHIRICSNEQCKQQHFPRTDPAIIVLVSCGERALLGRQALWPKDMYSTLAGFVEPGESLENAVMREVCEETGVQLSRVCYHSSQPWPFPASLMLGFFAQAASETLRVDREELEDARWFSRPEIEHALRSGTLRLPSTISIAFRLIEDWYDAAQGMAPLREVSNSA